MTKELDPNLIEAARSFQLIAQAANVPTILVGAFARDIYLSKISSLKAYRKTKDVDFAVLVESWAAFEFLRNQLFHSHLFSPHPNVNVPHKIYYQHSIEVDLVPFGPLVDKDGLLRCWPNDFGNTMNLTGFNEAFRSSVIKNLGNLEIRTLALESLVVLKLVSWNDQKDRIKDAIDLALIIQEHANLPDRSELLWSNPYSDLVTIEEEYEDQVARLLGRQIGLIGLTPLTMNLVKEILTRESQPDNNLLASAMHQHMAVNQSKRAFLKILAGIDDVSVPR